MEVDPVARDKVLESLAVEMLERVGQITFDSMRGHIGFEQPSSYAAIAHDLGHDAIMVLHSSWESESRRYMAQLAERMGWRRIIDAWVAHGLGVLLDDDGEHRLWALKINHQHRHFLLVEVQNSTPKPDGTRETYFIPVDTGLRPIQGTSRVSFGAPQAYTAKNAIASTFGLRGEEYDVGAAS